MEMSAIRVLLVLSLLGCVPRGDRGTVERSSDVPVSRERGAVDTLSVTGCPGEIRLTVGQSLVVKLEARRGTPYVWKPAEALNLLSLETPDVIEYEDLESDGEELLVGRDARQVLRFLAVGPGDEVVRLSYASFEPSEYERSCSFSVHVE